MSKALFGRGIKNSWLLFVVFALVLSMYIVVIVWMYDPELAGIMQDFEAMMPEMMAVLGMVQMGGGLADFLSAYLYGMLLQVLPMVFTILIANRLVVKLVDSGSMALLLAAPVRRRRIVLTQLAVLLCGIVAIMVFSAGVGLASAELLFPGEMDYAGYALINVGALALQLCIGGICFFASCVFNETRYAMALGAGLPVLQFIIKMAANYGGELENLKYGTFFTLYGPDALLAGESWPLWGMAILAAAGAALFAAGAVAFCRRDLPV